jgi:N4-gp56 family major capsid protein
MQFTWSLDAPSGTYKNHAISNKLRFAAVEKAVLADFVKAEPGFGKKMGESISITRVRNLTEPGDASLGETEFIPEDNFAISNTSITAKEIGRAVSFSGWANILSKFDLEDPIQQKLRDQMALVMDSMIATAMKTAKIKYAITGPASANIATTGTFGATSTDNLNAYHVEEIADYMYDTLQAPPYEGEDYIGVFRTLSIRGLMRDPDWEEWHKYTDPSAKLKNEAGRYSGIRFVKTNHNKAFGKVGTGSVLGEGVVFGEDSTIMAEVLTPELRMAIPKNFGRFNSIAWYGGLNYGLTWDTANAGEARVMHVGSL